MSDLQVNSSHPSLPPPAAVLGSTDSDGDLPLSVGSAQDDSESTALLSPMVAATVGSTGAPPASSTDDVDGTSSHLADLQRVHELIKVTQDKISKCKEAIKQEQRTRDENVDEYLRVSANTVDKHHVQKMKSVFEKKNQKSSQRMAHLQRKLQIYLQRQRQLETSGLDNCRPTKGVLKDVGQGLRSVGGNIRHGITGLSGTVVENVKEGIQGAAGTVMSKPREIAHLLKNRFGSADNITTLSSDSPETTPNRSHHGSATLPPGIPSIPNAVCYSRSEEASDISSVASDAAAPASVGSPRPPPSVLAESRQLQLFSEMSERREELERLREEVDTIKSTLQQEVSCLQQQLHEERERHERIEEQLNDFIELHQNEMENVRQQISDAEEKVQYQSEERLRDVHELLDKCSTRILRIEHQQLEHQQFVNIEVIGNSQARALIVKLVNCVLTALQLLLLLVNTAVGVSAPFLRTRVRVVLTVCSASLVALLAHHWPTVSWLLHSYVLGRSADVTITGSVTPRIPTDPT